MDVVSYADPLLSFYDDATGEHVALSAVELGSWAARSAALLTSGCGLGPGSTAAFVLPPHWQTAAALLGAWSAGVSVSFRLGATAGLPVLAVDSGEPLSAVFVSRGQLDDWLVDVPAATHRFLLDVGDERRPVATPPDYREFLTALSTHTSSPDPEVSLRATDPASVDGTTYAQWGALAAEIASRASLSPGDRLLVDASEHEHPVKWLLAPLSAGASVVLCANLDRSRLDSRMAAERVTHVL
ncbi:TIGR03089 family protein [Asanoa sp. WMMD1127]|uniref:TIGR03089 family protein n=1 Tax=Asanoa sp. WMMD1127 TaxID=3016107 RepID=UPI002417A616|nr:TIGR03089 family protein [Asanoa sp. WMMD1127]MDG4826506.1 TIGR03089 family protein [Asanoa sp. WMMD1127]